MSAAAVKKILLGISRPSDHEHTNKNAIYQRRRGPAKGGVVANDVAHSAIWIVSVDKLAGAWNR